MIISTIKKDFETYKKNPSIFYMIKSYFSWKGQQAVILFRISNWFYKKGFDIISKIIRNKNIKLTGCEIGQQTIIGPGLHIGHSNGIVISGEAVIGSRLTVMQQVTIGASHNSKGERKIIIGDDVFIGAGAKVLGVTVGDNVIIGANSVVIKDVLSNCTVAGNPAHIIKKNKENN